MRSRRCSGPGRPLGDTEMSGRRVTCKAPVAHLHRRRVRPVRDVAHSHSPGYSQPRRCVLRSSFELAFLIAQWRERAKIMSTALGFLDSRLHRAFSSRTRFQRSSTSPNGIADRRGKPSRRTRSFKPACVFSGRRHRSADLRELKALYQVCAHHRFSFEGRGGGGEISLELIELVALITNWGCSGRPSMSPWAAPSTAGSTSFETVYTQLERDVQRLGRL
jgi:hypothetical protein